MNSLILAWFCGLLASWMTFAATPDARSFLNMPAMVFLLGLLAVVVPGERPVQPPAFRVTRVCPTTFRTDAPLFLEFSRNALTRGFARPGPRSDQPSPLVSTAIRDAR